MAREPRLSGKQAQKARELYWFNRVPLSEVARLYGLSDRAMQNLIHGVSYRWAKGPKGEADRRLTPPAPVLDPTTKRLRRRMFCEGDVQRLAPPYVVINEVLFETWEDISEKSSGPAVEGGDCT